MDKKTMIRQMEISDEFFLSTQDEKGHEVTRKLQKLGDGGVVFVTVGDDRVIGFITKDEIMSSVVQMNNPSEMIAKNIMNLDFVEVSGDETLGDFLPKISKGYPNAVVVIDPDRRCLGYFSRKDLNEAMAGLGYYDKSRKPETSSDWLTRGIAMSNQGQVDDAMKCYEKSVALHANEERAWSNLAKNLEDSNKDKDAIKCYSKVVTINSENKTALIKRGNLYAKQASENLAIRSYNLVLSMDPNNVDALINLGLEHSKKGNLLKSIEFYNKAEAIDGETSSLWNKKGNAYNRAKYHEDALKCYNRAIEMDKEYEEALFNKSTILVKLKKEEESIECLQEILKINPNNTSACEALANLKKPGRST